MPMGNTNFQACRQTNSQSLAYGEFELYLAEGKQLALIHKKIQNKEGLADSITHQLEKRIQIKSKHVVKLHSFSVKQCAYEVQLSLFYQYMPQTLREYLLSMRLRGEEMNEKQIFGLIYGVEQGLQALYEIGATHNCINLDTILCRNGFFKVTDVSATTNVASYNLVLQGDREQFLSQQLLNNLRCNLIKPVGISIKDDLFSLAMIVLMIVSGSKPQNFYMWQKTDKMVIGSFNVKHIEHCVMLLNRNFSSKLVAKVKQILSTSLSVFQDKQSSSLTASLHDLQEDMSRVLNKIKNKAASNDTKFKKPNHKTLFDPSQ